VTEDELETVQFIFVVYIIRTYISIWKWEVSNPKKYSSHAKVYVTGEFRLRRNRRRRGAVRGRFVTKFVEISREMRILVAGGVLP